MATKRSKLPIEVTADQTARYETLMPLLRAMAEDFDELARKRPDGVLNERKVELVNRLLTDVLSLLADEPTAGYLDKLTTESLPQNSDVVLILGQCVAAMESFHSRHIEYGVWNIKQ